ncbi:MAG: divergent polysaccharide deacetylase family protein [Gemmobacter sp.]|nr:divergent polysaccharide deacetylase family protein [Gemmobacter sp.]
MRGVVSGLIWGGVVSVFGLGVVSQLAPLPGAEVAANDIVAPEAVQEAEPVKAPEPVLPEPVLPEPTLSEPTVSEAQAETAGAEVEAAAPATPAPAKPAAEAPSAAGPSSEGAAAPVDPAAAPLPGEVPAHSPLAPEVVGEPEAAAPLEPMAPAEPLLDVPAEVPAEAPGAAAPGVPDLALAEPAAPTAPADLAPEVELPAPATPEAAAPEPVMPEPVTPEAVTPEPVAPLAPAASLPEAVAGVTTNRLPRIEAAPQEGSAPASATAPEAEMAAQPADTRPVTRYAARFDNAAGKPLYAILLLDDGAAGLDRAALAAMPLPLTIVLDPTTPEAGKLAAEYRKAGKEVAMLASSIPKGATPSDLQVSFEAHAKALPEAVAVVDLPVEGFQNNRKLAADLLPVIKDQGRGLVTFDKGLNAGDQVARREGVPAALIFRELDAEGEAAPLIRRYLDRAAFKAVQDGRVAVLGRARPETIAALLEWSVEGRAGSVALAPLTAVLSVPE